MNNLNCPKCQGIMEPLVSYDNGFLLFGYRMNQETKEVLSMEEQTWYCRKCQAIFAPDDISIGGRV